VTQTTTSSKSFVTTTSGVKIIHFIPMIAICLFI
jgi:hypothetical protein